MAVRAYLYDSNATDQEVNLTQGVVSSLHDQQLLWVDLNDFEDQELHHVAALLALQDTTVAMLQQPQHRPRLEVYDSYAQFNLNTIQEAEGNYTLVKLDFVLSRNLIVTVHRQPVAFLSSFDDRIHGDTNLGRLDAPTFLAALLDWHVNSYFRLVESLEQQVDKIDVHALQPHYSHDLLSDLSRLRRRVAFVRQVLIPHREVYAAMARPDFQILAGSASASHYTILSDRLERAIDAVENARELLIGSFDMFATQMTLHTNEVMKVLTLVSAILYPASLIIGFSSLLLKVPVNPTENTGFWWMIAVMALISFTTLLIARRRRWI